MIDRVTNRIARSEFWESEGILLYQIIGVGGKIKGITKRD